ncbi:putative reverse transcriptase domain-containing protein [Tanacetum coccineum]
MDLMNRVCKLYLDNFMIVFIDDILIYSKNKNEHEGHLKLILRLLKEEKLFAKFFKCELWLSTVKFRSHTIDSKGMQVDLAKIESIKDLASPKTLTEIHQFLGLAERRSCIQLLKQKLCCAPILALREGSENFVVYCDASYKGLGAVLIQREKVIAYASRQLNIHEKNYTTHDIELGVIPPKKDERGGRCLKPEGKDSATASLSLSADYRIESSKKILNAQAEARKEENYIAEDLHGMINKCEHRDKRTLCLNNRSWIVTFPTYKRRRLNGEVDEIVFEGNYLEEWSASTQLDMSIAYHPQIEGQSDRTIQTLEDMLLARVLDFGRSWDRHLSLVEFSYNNNYHTSIKAAPFEALYGCSVDHLSTGLKLEIVSSLAQRSSTRQLRRSFKLRVVFKLPEILKRATQIFLPRLDEIQIDDKLHFIEEPIEIIDCEVKRLKQSRIPIVKVRWNSRRGHEFTWEREDQMKKKYPHLFTNSAPVTEITS